MSDANTVVEVLTTFRTIFEGLMTVAAPYIAWKLASLEGQGNNQKARDILETAIDRGTGLGLDYAIAAADPLLQNEANKHNALNIALNYAAAHTGDEAKLLNVSEAALSIKVQAALANKLHPAIVAAMPPTAPTPSPAPALPATLTP